MLEMVLGSDELKPSFVQGPLGSIVSCSKSSCRTVERPTADAPALNDQQPPHSNSQRSIDKVLESYMKTPRLGKNPIPSSLPAYYNCITQDNGCDQMSRNSPTPRPAYERLSSPPSLKRTTSPMRQSGASFASHRWSRASLSSSQMATQGEHRPSGFCSPICNSGGAGGGSGSPRAEGSTKSAGTASQPIPDGLPACYPPSGKLLQRFHSLPIVSHIATTSPSVVCNWPRSTPKQTTRSSQPPVPRDSGIQYFMQAEKCAAVARQCTSSQMLSGNNGKGSGSSQHIPDVLRLMEQVRHQLGIFIMYASNLRRKM